MTGENPFKPAKAERVEINLGDETHKRLDVLTGYVVHDFLVGKAID